MSVQRDELTRDGQKVCMLILHRALNELYKLSKNFFAIVNLDSVREISQEEAINLYIHPNAKDLFSNPKEIFDLKVLKNSFKVGESVTTLFQTPSGTQFEFAQEFKTSSQPKLTIVALSDKYSQIVCQLQEGNINATVRSFEDLFFLEMKGRLKRIPEEEAILFYIDPKANNLITDPATLFPSLKEVSKKDTTTTYKTNSDATFDFKIDGGKPTITIRQKPLKQRTKLGGIKLS